MEFAVAVARRVLAAHPADRGVRRALEDAGIALEGMGLGGGGARVRALRERIVGDEVVRPKSSKRPSADPVRAFERLLDELAARGFTDRKGRESWRFFPIASRPSPRGATAGAPVDIGVAFEAARHGPLGRFKVYFCDFRGMAPHSAPTSTSTRPSRARWAGSSARQAQAIVDFVLSGAGVVELDGFETSGPRGLDTPAANVLVGYLADAAGRPELRQPCLGRAAELYGEVLDRTEPRDEELATLVERLEADAAT